MAELPKLSEVLPTLAMALRTSLLRVGEPTLAQQVDELRIHATCACQEDGCLSLFVAAPRGVPCGDDCRTALPDAVISIGVCADRMEYIEDNALIRDAEDTLARSSEYRAVEGTVPTRLPTDL